MAGHPALAPRGETLLTEARVNLNPSLLASLTPAQRSARERATLDFRQRRVRPRLQRAALGRALHHHVRWAPAARYRIAARQPVRHALKNGPFF